MLARCQQAVKGWRRLSTCRDTCHDNYCFAYCQWLNKG